MKFEKFTEYSTVGDVIGDAAFKNFGRLLFPVHRPLSGKMTLKEVSSSQVYLWYSHIQVEKTLDILNTLKERALEGEQVFYPIYTQREMAAVLGNRTYLRQFTGRREISQAAAVVMQYTGYTSVSGRDAPTYACVGSRDGIADWRVMRRRLEILDSMGIPTEFHVYEGLGHGFGLGTGTVAQGWIFDALRFWQKQIDDEK